jgi:hypothetical protein
MVFDLINGIKKIIKQAFININIIVYKAQNRLSINKKVEQLSLSSKSVVEDEQRTFEFEFPAESKDCGI